MKITINPKGLTPNEDWLSFRKVRAIIENEKGQIAISIEGGKYIFPGGKCGKDEEELVAIQREICEETGINLEMSDLHKILELETIYDDFFDYRTQSIKPRYTITTYYYVKTKKNINESNMHLEEGEIKQNFKILFVDRDILFKMLQEDHSNLENGRFFDEENKVIVEKVLKKNN